MYTDLLSWLGQFCQQRWVRVLALFFLKFWSFELDTMWLWWVWGSRTSSLAQLHPLAVLWHLQTPLWHSWVLSNCARMDLWSDIRKFLQFVSLVITKAPCFIIYQETNECPIFVSDIKDLEISPFIWGLYCFINAKPLGHLS